jgi:hypothetical protein
MPHIVILVDVADIAHGFLANLLGDNELDVTEPLARIQTFTSCFVPETGDSIGADIVRGKRE